MALDESPPKQGKHAVKPVAPANVPVSHSRHPVDPLFPAYVPAAQEVHAVLAAVVFE